MTTAGHVQVVLRVPVSLRVRVDRIAETLPGEARGSRAAAFRHVIELGASAVEREAGSQLVFRPGDVKPGDDVRIEQRGVVQAVSATGFFMNGAWFGWHEMVFPKLDEP